MSQQVTNVSPRVRTTSKSPRGEVNKSPRGVRHDFPARSDQDKENIANVWPDNGTKFADNVLKSRTEALNHRTKHVDDIYCEHGLPDHNWNQPCDGEYRASFLKYEREVAHMAEELRKKDQQLEEQRNALGKHRSEIDIHERARLDQMDKYKSQLSSMHQDLKACKQALHEKDEELAALKEEVRRKGFELSRKEGLEAQRESQRQAQLEEQSEAQQEAQRAKDELKKVSNALAEVAAKDNSLKHEYQLLHDRFLKLKQEKERLACNTTPGEFLKMVRSKESGVQVWQQVAHLRERIADLEWESEVQRRHLTPAALQAVSCEMGQPAQEPSL